jgi:hypothetical protein
MQFGTNQFGTGNRLMKINKTLTVCSGLLAIGLTTQAQTVSLSNTSVGSAANFPTLSISGNNGTLAFESVGTTPAGATQLVVARAKGR